MKWKMVLLAFALMGCPRPDQQPDGRAQVGKRPPAQGQEAGSEAGSEARPEPEAGPEGAEAGPEAGPEARQEAGPEAGSEAVPEAGSEAKPDVMTCGDAACSGWRCGYASDAGAVESAVWTKYCDGQVCKERITMLCMPGYTCFGGTCR